MPRRTSARFYRGHNAAGLPVSIFLLRTFFDAIPRELEEAARIDGCSDFGAF